MTKALTAAMKAHIAGTVTTLASCWRLTRTDGGIFTFTGHDRDLLIDGLTYQSSSSFDRSAVESDPTMSVDNLEIQGVFDSEALRADELRAGLFDRAAVELFMVNWADLSMGRIRIRRGWLGEVTLTPSGIFKSEIRGLIQALQQNVGEFYTTQPLSYGTPILTRDRGVIPIGSAAGEEVTLLDGERRWVKCRIEDHGEQETVELTFKAGRGGSRESTVRATEAHGWIATDGRRATTADLVSEMTSRPGRRTAVAMLSPSKAVGDREAHRRGVVHGLVYGDGTLHRSDGSPYHTVDVYSHVDDLAAILDGFSSFPTRHNAGGGRVIEGRQFVIPGSFSDFRSLKELPDPTAVPGDYLLGFLRGWLAADGCVAEQPYAKLSCHADGVAWLRRWAPVVGWLPLGASPQPAETNLGRRTRDQFDVVFARDSISDVDLLVTEHRRRWEDAAFTEQPRRWKLSRVGDRRVERVFCASVPTTGSFALGCFVHSSNCRADLGDSRCRIPVNPPIVGRGQAVVALQNWRKADESLSDDGSSLLYHDVIFQVLVAGTTALTDVIYDYAVGAETVDGTATFLAVTAWSRYGVVSADGSVLFSTDTDVGGTGGGRTAMVGGDELLPGGSILSPSGRFQLQLQFDSNVVLTDLDGPTVLWATATNGASPAAASLIMQTDGNLVLYSTTGTVLYATDTAGNPGATLALQDDGNLVLYAASGSHRAFTATWPYGVDVRISAGAGNGAAASPDTWFVDGILTWETGANVGMSMEVQNFDHAIDQFSLHLPMGFAIGVGDKFRVYAGCSKLIGVKPAALQSTSVYGTFSGTTLTVVDPDGCKPKFDNAVNFRGEPYLPGVDFIVGQAGLNKPGFSTSGGKK